MKMTADGYATLRSYLGSLSKDFVNGVEGMIAAFNADGKVNYVKASKKLNIDFVANPDLVLQLDNATKIMLLGMREGWFTTHKLSDYIKDGKVDFINARRIINGTDCAEQIAKHASVFYNALRKP